MPIAECGDSQTKRLNDEGNFGWRIEVKLEGR